MEKSIHSDLETKKSNDDNSNGNEYSGQEGSEGQKTTIYDMQL